MVKNPRNLNNIINIKILKLNKKLGCTFKLKDEKKFDRLEGLDVRDR